MIHEVKSWSHFFDSILRGQKTHDLRKNDRDFKVGDILKLCQYDNINGAYTGDFLYAKVTYITSHKTPCAFSSAVLPNDYCILSISIPAVSQDDWDLIAIHEYEKAA